MRERIGIDLQLVYYVIYVQVWCSFLRGSREHPHRLALKRDWFVGHTYEYIRLEILYQLSFLVRESR